MFIVEFETEALQKNITNQEFLVHSTDQDRVCSVVIKINLMQDQ